MLKNIIRFSLYHRMAVFAVALFMMLYGVYLLPKTKLDVFPDFSPATATVQIEAPGFSSEQVETLITLPLERELSGLQGLQSSRSKSIQGLALLTFVFEDNANVEDVRRRMAERLTQSAINLPSNIPAPKLLPLTSSASTLLMFGLSSKTQSLMDLHELAEWTIKPQLIATAGVADVIVFGGEKKQIQIQFDPLTLARYDLSLSELNLAIQKATGIRPAGFVEQTNQRIMLQTQGQNKSPEDLAKVIVHWRDGVALRLGDIAQVVYAGAPVVGGASIKGEQGVIFVVEGQYGVNTLQATQAIEKKLAALKPFLVSQQVQLEENIFRPANFIAASMQHLGVALAVGAVLVILVLIAFLMNARTALISALAIPISLLAAVSVLNLMGVTLNAMTLGGLAIALGEIVDDAIIDVENIYRRLKENSARENPASQIVVVLRASLEVRSAVVFATLIVIVIFLPLVFLSGVAGKLFAPLAIAYLLAVVASLLVAITLTPALCLTLLNNKSHYALEASWLVAIKRQYQMFLQMCERKSKWLMFCVGSLCLISFAALPFMQGNFIPALREGHFIAHLSLASGSSLTETLRIGASISTDILKIQGIRTVAQTAGRATDVIDPAGVHVSELDIDLVAMSAQKQEHVLKQVRDVLAKYVGVSSSVNTFLTERIDETIAGNVAPFAIKVFGDDLDVIDKKAFDIAQIVQSVRGAASVRVEEVSAVPELNIRLKMDQLARWGLQPVPVLDAIQAAYQGVTISQVFDANKMYDVNVILKPALREHIDNISNLLLPNAQAQLVPLRELASISMGSGRYQINHANGLRVQTVAVQIAGRPVSEFVQEVKKRIKDAVPLSANNYLLYSGVDEARQQSMRDLMAQGTLAVCAIIVLLGFAFKNLRQLLLVLFNLPFALVGGVLAVLCTGADLSLGAMVGFVTLFGISLRNTIMLISHFNYLVVKENRPWCFATAVKGAKDRFAPIMMTALVTGLALLPLAINRGEAGNEIEGAMAVVILGGLVTSTLLTLILLPCIAVRFAKFN